MRITFEVRDIEVSEEVRVTAEMFVRGFLRSALIGALCGTSRGLYDFRMDVDKEHGVRPELFEESITAVVDLWEEKTMPHWCEDRFPRKSIEPAPPEELPKGPTPPPTPTPIAQPFRRSDYHAKEKTLLVVCEEMVVFNNNEVGVFDGTDNTGLGVMVDRLISVEPAQGNYVSVMVKVPEDYEPPVNLDSKNIDLF
jgi:hypothetical protein